ncbi:hypothetical protein F5X99DRAFT_275360 [Biscogniauxia marginata]|nr:hypothetical protein F5X99DRAFT_275360 [Biscogniauxia marginata]
MSKRSTFTTISPLPPGISREFVVGFLHNHQEMIDLNPLIIERHPISPPPHAPAEEQRCVWWSMTDKISYLPGGAMSGEVTYTAAFNDLPNGVQTHSYAPMGTDIRGRWSLNGTLPGEPLEPVELGLGAPRQGLYLREDVELRCNFMMSSFVKKTLKKAHGTLVDRLCEKAQLASSRNPGMSAGTSTAHAPAAPSCSSSSAHSGSDKGASANASPGDGRMSSGSRSTDSNYPNIMHQPMKPSEFSAPHTSRTPSPYQHQHQQQQHQHQRHHSGPTGIYGQAPPRSTPPRVTSASYSTSNGNNSSHGQALSPIDSSLVPEPLRLGHMRTGSGAHFMHPNWSSSSGAPQIPPLAKLDHGLQQHSGLGLGAQNGWPGGGGSGRGRALDGAVYDPHAPGRRHRHRQGGSGGGGGYPAELE